MSGRVARRSRSAAEIALGIEADAKALRRRVEGTDIEGGCAAFAVQMETAIYQGLLQLPPEWQLALTRTLNGGRDG